MATVQPRGQVYTTTPDTIALVASSGQTALNGTALPSLVTATAGLVLFDAPQPGRLRYTGSESRTFDVDALLSVQSAATAPVRFAFRIAKNGTSILASEQVAHLWDFQGLVSVGVHAIVELAGGDYLEVSCAATVDADLEVQSMSLVATGDLLAVDTSQAPLPGGGLWDAIEARSDSTLRSSVLTEDVTFSGVAVRGVFEIEGYEVDADGVRIATGSPMVDILAADLLPTVPDAGQSVSVRGVSYVVASVGPVGAGWWRAHLHEA